MKPLSAAGLGMSLRLNVGTILAVVTLSLAMASSVFGASIAIIHDGTAGIEADVLANVSAKQVTAGNTVSSFTSVAAAGVLSTYEQIWDIRFNNPTPLTPADQAAYQSYVGGGGNLFLDGENAGFATRNDSLVSFISLLGGGNLILNTPANTETVNAPLNASIAGSSITYLAANGALFAGKGSHITIDSNGIGAALLFGPGNLTNAPLGSVIVVFDVNFLQASADAASQQLIANIITYLNTPTIVPSDTLLAFWKGGVNSLWSTKNGGTTNWSSAQAGTTDLGKLPNSLTSDVTFSATGAANQNSVLGADFTIRSLTVNDPAPVTIGGLNTLTIVGPITVNSGAGLLTLNSGGLVASAPTPMFTVNNSAGMVVNSGLGSSGTSGLSKFGTGTLTLSGSNTYTGPTVVNAGTLLFTREVALYNNVPANWNSGKITVSNGATLILNVGGTGEFTSADVDILKAIGTGGGGLLTGSTFALDTTNAAGGKFTYVNNLTNTNGGVNSINLTKLGANTLALNGANSYTGITTVFAGTLQFGKEVSFYNNTPASWTAANIKIASAATLALNVGGPGEFTSADVDSIKTIGSPFSGFTGGSILGLDTTNAAGGQFTYATVIGDPNGGTNSIGLTKLGTNMLNLTGANTYTGPTTVNAGTLLVNGSIASSSAVTIGTDGALGGTGTGPGTITANGAIAPGAGSVSGTYAILNTGSITFSSTGSLVVNAGAGSANNDAITSTGVVQLAGTLTVNATGLNQPSYVLISAPSISGKFTTVTPVAGYIVSYATPGRVTLVQTVPIVGAGVDSDGDGFSDTFETAVGSDPNNAISTPTGQPITNSSLQKLSVAKTAIKQNFAKAGNDAISLSGGLLIPDGTVVGGQKVYVDIGGVTGSFTLDAKGVTPKASNSFAVGVKSAKGVVLLQVAKFAVKFTKGSFVTALAAHGLVNATTTTHVTIPVSLVFNGDVLQKQVTLSYKASAGKGGAAK